MAVCLKHTNEFIGNLFGLWEKDTFSACWNFLPNYCGKGYAYESARAYLDYLFNHMNARRIYAHVEDYNISSQRLCEKLGMRQEGLFKEFISFINNPDGTPLYENTMQFSILKKEWNKQSQI
ncbi:acetyltransferase, GNAT family [Helicobacter pullorum MIT 98-5489]|uniref:Acetyltransferase, GNAT family n=1 Tax=Helicobacter pullorum MIT 98-5489 TaxID=537972 RepID=C5EXI5_9HELI|nr:GNAT family protein [Helicobacter pullorum]EEQ62996.1 acetyltransferase, GNAT family [Helicobacter pullorum MIT 98-5489]